MDRGPDGLRCLATLGIIVRLLLSMDTGRMGYNEAQHWLRSVDWADRA